MLPAIVPVTTCSINPINCAVAGSQYPSEIPITPKKEPGGVFDIKSIITNRPDIPQAAMKPAKVQYMMNNLEES